jgi:hypothetical protein
MALSINDHDARDLELQREIQAAREVFLSAAGDERSIARGHYLKLLKASPSDMTIFSMATNTS